MQRKSLSFISFFLLLYFAGCSPKQGGGWTDFIHEDATFVIVADASIKASELAAKDYFTYLEDLTPFSMQQLGALDVEFSSALPLKALVLYPATSVESHYMWISESQDLDIEEWAHRYYEPFAQNNYEFFGYRIHRLLLNGNGIFAAQTGKWLILSKSSFVIENALRTYNGQLKTMDITHEPEAGSFILNTPALDIWLQQFTKIDTRPAILNSFLGTRPVSLNFSHNDAQNELEITGRIELASGKHSVLTDAISFENKAVRLDRHIGTNAAAFAILRLPPAAVPATPEFLQSPLDSLLMGNLSLYQQLASTLDNEFAMVAYPESGLTNSGEYLYMRTLKNKSALIALLDDHLADGYITKNESTYFINSTIFAELIGSELAVLRDFYLSFSDDVAVIAKRRGLAESVNADRTRRRVMYYDESYSKLRNELPAAKSAFVWVSSGDFLKFIDPLLKPEQVASSLISRFDMVAINMAENAGAVDVTIKTLQREGSFSPYEELWVLPLSGTSLSAPPVLGNLVGSRADEVVISTTNGEVYVIAADGTVAMRASTNGLAPVGGPVLYDWYGNGQLVILLPAGNKIFAWNSNGDLLPSFPMELEANISAPILVEDILRNGVPEIVAATENRKVHVLNNRGNNVNGWPQNTNAVVTEQPVFQQFEGNWNIFAFSENALHSWLRAGTPRAEFPQFINARFTGSPLVFDEQILGSAADGYLYSIGRNPFFTDSSTIATDTLDEVKVNYVSISGFELASVSLVKNVLLRDESGFFREDLLLTVSTNGSVFLYNKEGRLRFTQSLGQPASTTYKPQVIDIDRNRNMDVVVLAEFGRLFAWELLTGERLYGLPTSGMRFPIITDLNNDGQYELIAETREGLRAWTIRRID